MASKVDLLLMAYETVVQEPWPTYLSGQEKVWFLVYDPAEQRKIDLRLGDFETTTQKANKKWGQVSLKNCFPDWMEAHEYKEAYFARPELLADQLEIDFKQYVIRYLSDEISNLDTDEHTLIAVKDIASLFGFCRVSDIISSCAQNIKGRMLIFFPGDYDTNQYRLLNARDGWSYLARPISVK